MKVVFPSGSLLYDYKELCTDFNLAVAEEYAQDYEVPDLPQVVFLAMLLNDAAKLGVLCGWMIVVMGLALKELRWNAFQVWIGHNRARIMEAHRQYPSNDLKEEESSESDDQAPLYNDDNEE